MAATSYRIYIYTTHITSWIAFLAAAPFIQLMVGMLLHCLSPIRPDLAPHLRDPASQPYYKIEADSEKAHGYSRHYYKTTTTHQHYVVVAPEQRQKHCVVWVPGFCRYFSHHSTVDINFGNDVDLCGLDLPCYGRAYMHTGGHDNLNNLWNAVPPSSCWRSILRVFGCSKQLRASFYYDVYEETTIHLKEDLGYDKIFYMCNSTSGLTMQCYIEEAFSHKIRKEEQQADGTDAATISGIIFSAPFWWPTERGKPLLTSPIFELLNVVALLFPTLMLFDDDVKETWLSEGLEKAHASGRTTVSVDPILNPVDKTPYFIEWLAMVSEAQNYLMKKSQKTAIESNRPRAMLLTNDGMDHNVDVNAVHEMFPGLYPKDKGMQFRILGANHEMMFSEKEQFEIASKHVRAFLREGIAEKPK